MIEAASGDPLAMARGSATSYLPPEDRYLDSSRVIRQLEEAEEAHQLDAQGALEELGKAISHCGTHYEHHTASAEAYMLARTLYCAEVHRRVSLTLVESGRKGCAVRDGRPDPIPERIGAKAWCAENNISYQYFMKLAKMGQSADPLLAVQNERVISRGKLKKRRQRHLELLGNVDVRLSDPDPLRQFKKEWFRLSPGRRHMAVEWLFEVAPWIWQAEAAD